MLLEKKNRIPPHLAEIPYGFKNLWMITVSAYSLQNSTFNVSDIVTVELNGEPVTADQLQTLFDYKRDPCSLLLSNSDSGLYVTLNGINEDKTIYTFRTLTSQTLQITGVISVSGDVVNNADPQNPAIGHDTQKLDVATYNTDQTALNTRLTSDETSIQNNTNSITNLQNSAVTAVSVNGNSMPVTNGTANITIDAVSSTQLNNSLNSKVDKTVAGSGNAVVQAVSDSLNSSNRTLTLSKTLMSLETGAKNTTSTSYNLAELLGITALENIDKELYYFTSDSNISTMSGTSTVSLSDLYRYEADGTTLYVPATTKNIQLVFGISTEYSGINTPSRNYISSIGRVTSSNSTSVSCTFTNLRLYNTYNRYNGYRGGVTVLDTASSSLYYVLQRVPLPTSEASVIPLTNTLYYRSIKDDSMMLSDTVWGNFEPTPNGGQAYSVEDARLKLLEVAEGYDNFVSFKTSTTPSQILTDADWNTNINLWVTDGFQFSSRSALLNYLSNFSEADRFKISNNGIVQTHYETGSITIAPVFTIAEITNRLNSVYQPILSSAVSGNFAVYNNSGVLVDSGKSSASFATSAQGTKADTAVQAVVLTSGATNGTIQVSVNGTPQTASVQGLGTAAYSDTGDFATSAQGTKADSALQNVSLLPGEVNGTIRIMSDGTTQGDVQITGLGTAAYTPSTDYATSAQGTKADTAVQSVQIATGTADGTILYGTNGGTQTPIQVKGLQSAAYTSSANYATSAQGTKADSALQKTDVVNNLTSTATDAPLSANAGRMLEQLIQSISPDGKPIGGFNRLSDAYINTINYASDLQPINVNDTIYIAQDENHTDMPAQYKVSSIGLYGDITYSFVRILPDSLRDFAFDPIQTSEIADGAVNSAKIQNESIVAEDIAPNAVTKGKLSNSLQTSIDSADNSLQTGLSTTGTGNFVSSITENQDKTLTVAYTNTPVTQVQIQGAGDFVSDVNSNGNIVVLNKNGTALKTINVTGAGNVITDASATANVITLTKGTTIQSISTSGTGNVITDISTNGTATKGTVLKNIVKSGTGNTVTGVTVSGETATLSTADAVTAISTSGSGDMVSGITLAGGTLQVTKAAVPQTVGDASTSQKGIVQLNDTLTSTSATEALTANQGKALNDKITSNDSTYVKTSGNQTVAGTKTFSIHPAIPSKTTLPVTPSSTQYATETQVGTRIAKPTTSTQNNIAVFDNANGIIDSGIAYTAIADSATAVANKQDKITASGILKSTSGTISQAVAGTDYATPTNITTSISTHNSASDAHSTLLSGKVDIVAGKGLSANDYTTTEKTKLAGIADGAQKNVTPVNNLTTSTTGSPLDAAQGKVLNDGKLDKTAQGADSAKLGGQLPAYYATKTAVDAAMLKTGGAFSSTVTGVSPTTVGNGGFRNIYVLAAGSTPSSALGANGDICIVLSS